MEGGGKGLLLMVTESLDGCQSNTRPIVEAKWVGWNNRTELDYLMCDPFGGQARPPPPPPPPPLFIFVTLDPARTAV
jgi:hypothetical protein